MKKVFFNLANGLALFAIIIAVFFTQFSDVKAAEIPSQFSDSAAAYILVDAKTGNVLAEKNSN